MGYIPEISNPGLLEHQFVQTKKGGKGMYSISEWTSPELKIILIFEKGYVECFLSQNQPNATKYPVFYILKFMYDDIFFYDDELDKINLYQTLPAADYFELIFANFDKIQLFFKELHNFDKELEIFEREMVNLLQLDPYVDQINRLLGKIFLAQKADPNFMVFGASSHQYKTDSPISLKEVSAFEIKYGIDLPADYKAFVCYFANGGIAYANAAAGPNYGIFPFGKGLDTLIDAPIESILTQEAIIANDWDVISSKFDDDDLSDEDYDKEILKLYGGLLVIGHLGCTGYQALVLNGEKKGHIVYVSTDLNPRSFTYENNFLDWYERWLDEIIAGGLQIDSSLFDYRPLPENQLDILKNSQDTDLIINALYAMEVYGDFTMKKLPYVLRLTSHENKEIAKNALILVMLHYFKVSTRIIKRFLEKDSDSKEFELAIDAINYLILKYGQVEACTWFGPQILEKVSSIKKLGTFRTVTQIIKAIKIDFTREIVPFCKHPNKEFRSIAYYILGESLHKNELVDKAFKEGLECEEAYTCVTILQSIGDLLDESYIPYFERLLKKHPDTLLMTNISRLREKLNS